MRLACVMCCALSAPGTPLTLRHTTPAAHLQQGPHVTACLTIPGKHGYTKTTTRHFQLTNHMLCCQAANKLVQMSEIKTTLKGELEVRLPPF